jgi:membrane protease YdiL (CAAX protease family)
MAASESDQQIRLMPVLLVAASWFAVTAAIPYLNRIADFRAVDPYFLPAIRMALMLLVTVLYVRLAERTAFLPGIRFSFRGLGRSLLWAVILAVVTYALVEIYQRAVVVPLTAGTVEASASGPGETLLPLARRIIQYAYIVFEGIVEVFIFIGFLVDRLARKWGWAASILVGNIVFALWHYAYWSKGLLEGSLMIGLTFIAGAAISISYFKTRNSLTPTVCHILVDLPSSIRELLGLAG